MRRERKRRHCKTFTSIRGVDDFLELRVWIPPGAREKQHSVSRASEAQTLTPTQKRSQVTAKDSTASIRAQLSQENISSTTMDTNPHFAKKGKQII